MAELEQQIEVDSQAPVTPLLHPSNHLSAVQSKSGVSTSAEPLSSRTGAATRGQTVNRPPAWFIRWLEKLELQDPTEPWDFRRFSMSAGFSILGHLVILLILALVVVQLRSDSARTLESQLAGSEFGDELSDQPFGGLGLDSFDPAIEPAQERGEPPELETVPVELPESKTDSTQAIRPPRSELVPRSPQAGDGDGFGVARYGRGTETIQGVKVKVGNPQFTLIWDTDVDLDLHVIEPGGSEISFWNRQGEQGGELDVDDTDVTGGRGPENVNYDEGRGKGPTGVYRWYVHYYGVNSKPTKWRVRVKADGAARVFEGKFSRVDQRSPEHSLEVTHRSSPSGSGVDQASTAGWAILAPTGAPFQLLFPSEPTNPDPAVSANPLVERIWTLEHDGASFRVAEGAADGRPLGSLRDWLEQQARMEAVREGALVRLVRPVAIGRATGVELVISAEGDVADQGARSGRARAFVFGDRLVILSVTGPKSVVEGSLARDFLESLREVPASLLDTAAPAAPGAESLPR
jgi:hypothetical protein